MLFSWLRHRRRRKLLASPFPDGWHTYLERLPFYATLSADNASRLRDTLRVIVAEKHWEGCGGLHMNDEIKVTVSASAALLLLNLEHNYYRRLRSIVVYPTTIVAQNHGRIGRLSTVGRQPVLGLAFLRGPVVLVWDSVVHGLQNPNDGRNVVLHEFAHKLDMLDDLADGTPHLEEDEHYKEWVRVMTEEYEDLVEAETKGQRTVLDKYGATNPAEFFAVATECFFEKSRTLKRKQPELYTILQSFYKQNPAARRR